MAKLPKPFSTLPELRNIHVSWYSPSGGSKAIDMIHKTLTPINAENTSEGDYKVIVQSRKSMMSLDLRDNF